MRFLMTGTAVLTVLLFVAPSALTLSVTTPPGPSTSDYCARINHAFASQPPRCYVVDTKVNNEANAGVYYIYALASAPLSPNACVTVNGVGVIAQFGVWKESNGIAGLQMWSTPDDDLTDGRGCGPWPGA